MKSKDNRYREDETKKMWKNYFNKVHNENPIKDVELDNARLLGDLLYSNRITELDIMKALKRMTVEKSIKSYCIEVLELHWRRGNHMGN